MGLVVVGAAGRMGRSLIETIAAMDGVYLAAALEQPGSAALGCDAGELAGLPRNEVLVTDDAATAFGKAEGVVDFTAPQASLNFAALAAEAGIVHVLGTTGMGPDCDAPLRSAADRACIVKSGNMSLGVNLLSELVEQAARALAAADWDIEVLEMHHRHKVDAPSGTALLLGEAAAAGRGIALADHAVRSRDGQTGARPDQAIGFATLRGGSVVGEHEVLFAGEGEMIELTHRALDRSIFARGAVKAALWGRGKSPGLYSMRDVLGLSSPR
ncbi:4-hydroxy-tetrahydrodipicolinate reductase [Pseudohoeflea sp. DP4N28-3]|uniref:4-hydroxy-tetrahydrodipicolinate reductase n=2 Tax=Pseudohoeflea coraliihabitans TaxID=2860393 RepID=A0ABS6WNX9_9HYPH|nr:4-hydroxy-tetrahydrodipicolinate reductase [Pseudohoeflea sp. DP4N28-3]